MNPADFGGFDWNISTNTGWNAINFGSYINDLSAYIVWLSFNLQLHQQVKTPVWLDIPISIMACSD